jgi:hypothetical protein
VYLTAVSAIDQMEKSFDHVKMSISLGHSDYARARAQLILVNWHFDENITRQITNLQLNLHDESWRGAHRLGLNDLTKCSLIDTSEVSYLGSFEPLYQRLCFSDLDLVGLRHLVLSNLCGVGPAFVDFWQKYRNQLTHVSLIKCSTTTRLAKAMFFMPPPTISWLSVINELLHYNNLVYLRLDRLRIETGQRSCGDFAPSNHMDKTMSQCATWLGKEEISRGLLQLAHQPEGLETHESEATFHPSNTTRPAHPMHPPPRGHRTFLSLRFASFKASDVYTWTLKEANALNNYRHHFVRGRQPGPPASPFEDDIEFPVPDCQPPTYPEDEELPRGHEKLPNLLWGQWTTVWVEHAVKVLGNW